MSTTKINAVEQIKTGSITSTLTDTSIIDAAGSHPFTAAANLGGFRATNAANGSAATDLVTLSQVQSMLMGLSPLISVQAMTTGSETYTVTSGAVTQINGTTVDGITLIVGDRILVKNAPAASGTGTADSSFAGSQYPANGVYTVTGTGTNLAAITKQNAGEILSGQIGIQIGVNTACRSKIPGDACPLKRQGNEFGSFLQNLVRIIRINSP